MKHTFRLCCAFLLIGLLLAGLGLNASSAYAAEIVGSGECGVEGNNVTWTLDSEGTLTLSGTGATAAMEGYRIQPWDVTQVYKIVVESGITALGNGLFANSPHINEISLPDTLTVIGDYCFQSCSLGRVDIPASVVTLGRQSFRSATASEIWFYGDKPTDFNLSSPGTDDVNQWSYFLQATIYYPSWNYTWNLIAMSDEPNKWLGNYYVELKDNGTEPDDTICLDETYDNGIHVTMTKAGYATITGTGDSTLEPGQFPYAARHVYIGSGVTAVDDNCVYVVYVPYMHTLEIGDDVTFLGEESFIGCDYLTTVKFGSGLEDLEKNAFYMCPMLKDVWFSGSRPDGMYPSSSSVFPDYDITMHYPAWNVTWQAVEAEMNTYTWVADTEAVAPEGADSVILHEGTWGENVTWKLSQTGILTISGEGEMISNHWSSSPLGVTRIEDFGDMIRSIVVEPGITKIGNSNFVDTAATSLTLPDTVTEIGSYAFQNCALTQIQLSEGLTNIGHYAFNGCPIAALKIPSTVTTIGDYAFQGHASEKIEVPASVTELGNKAFASQIMTELWFSGSKPTGVAWKPYTNSNYTTLCLPYDEDWAGTVYIPDWNITWLGYDTRSNGTAATWTGNGSAFAGEVIASGTYPANDAGDEVTWTLTLDGTLTFSGHGMVPAAERNYYRQDGTTIFKDYSSLVRQVVTESGITGIGDQALILLHNLNSVVLSETVETISKEAFKHCTSLTSIEIPGTVKTIADNAFCGSSLTEVRFTGSTVSSISVSAFKDLNVTVYYPVKDLTWTDYPFEYFEMNNGSMNVVAEDYDVEETVYLSGSCGENLTYTITNLGNMTIEGTGPMSKDLDFVDWIREIVVGDGVTSFEGNSFKLENVETVRFLGGAPTFSWGSSSDTTLYYSSWDKSWPSTVNSYSYLNWVDDGTEPTERIYRSGSCGDALTYTLTSLGVLTIEGTGDMTNYNSASPGGWDPCAPWLVGVDWIDTVHLPDGLTSIGDRAFWGLSALTELSIPDSVTRIGESAFENVKNLTELKLPAGLLTIDDEAFRDSSLTSFQFSDGLQTIGSYAFSGCPMTQLQLPDSVTEIGEYAFWTSALTSMTLPKSLTNLERGVFKECTALTSVVLNEGLTDIWDSAFSYCNALTAIEIPATVTEVGEDAFECCTALESVTLHEALTTIGANAFEGCTALKSIALPDSLTTIGDAAFVGCTALTAIEIPGTVTTVENSAFANCTSLTSVVLNEGITKLDEQAFLSCSALTEIVLPQSLTDIGSGAFQDCSALTAIEIPGTVINVGSSAFANCTSLSSAVLNEGITKLDEQAFLSCSALTEIVLPQTVTSIGRSCFHGCTALASVKLTGPIGRLSAQLFRDCTSLTSIEIPESVHTLESNVFAGSGLKDIWFYGAVPDVYYEDLDSWDTGYQEDRPFATSFGGIYATIHYPAWDIRWQMEDKDQWDTTLSWMDNGSEPNPETLYQSSFGEGLFWSLNTAGDLVISGSGTMPVYWSLTDFNGDELNEPLKTDTPWEAYKPYIRTVTVENGVKKLSTGALNDCSRLHTLTLPQYNCAIDSKCFTGCGSLNTVYFTGDKLSISYNAFYGSTVTAYYPDNLSWDLNAPGQFGGTITWVQQESEPITDPSIVAQGSAMFLNWKLDRNGVLTIDGSSVPEVETSGRMSHYYGSFTNSSSYPWHIYRDSITEIVIGDGVKDISDNAFRLCRLLAKVTVGNGVESIKDSAFESCELLERISLGSSVTSINSYAFEYCSKLKTFDIGSLEQWIDNRFSSLINDYNLYIAGQSVETLVIPASMGEVPKYALENCANLKHLTISEGITTIGENAFSNCDNLETIIIPGSVTSIQYYSFANLPKLDKVFFTGLAPLFNGYSFQNVECTAYYPGSNPTWTEAKRQDYGGDIKWVNSEAPHTHTYGDWSISIAPGCLTEGQELRSCTQCGQSETRVVPATGHSYGEYVITTPPTCTADGAQSAYCGNCGEAVTETVPAVGHSFGDYVVTTAPTCTEEGEQTATCGNCGQTQTEAVPAIGHNFRDYVVTTAPTCTEEGVQTATCGNCGQTQTEAVPAIGHNFRDYVITTAPTCTTDGEQTATCGNCGETVTQAVPAAHSFGNWVILKEATSMEEGEQQRTCTACGEVETQVIPKVTIVFNDVKDNDWFAPYVNWAVANSITSGVGGGNFAPNTTCTRAQVVTFLWRAAGCPEPAERENPFIDVPEGIYYYKPVMWALENNITAGISTNQFGPDQACTRAQVVTFLWRANGQPAPTKTDNPFTDVVEGTYFYQPILWAVENGITAGTSATTFDPSAFCTRAQIVTFIYRNEHN